MTTNRTNPERLLAQAGGVSGVIYSSLPVLTFVVVSSVSGLLPAIGSALGVAALILLWRLIRRESTQPALSGFMGVAICALIAYLLGQSKGYFLLGIWMSLLWAVVFTVSVLIRRPMVCYLWSWAGRRDRGWRDVPEGAAASPTEVLAHLRARGADCDICTAASIGDLDRVQELLDHDP